LDAAERALQYAEGISVDIPQENQEKQEVTVRDEESTGDLAKCVICRFVHF
jgi:hypothetical protein